MFKKRGDLRELFRWGICFSMEIIKLDLILLCLEKTNSVSDLSQVLTQLLPEYDFC